MRKGVNNLEFLNCSYNKLNTLPILSNKLCVLHCSNNNLDTLPILPNSLEEIYIKYNPIYEIINNMKPTKRSIKNMRYIIKKLHNFKHLYYSLKLKTKFRKILWEKIREPKIRLKYHPTNLNKLLANINDKTFQSTLDSW